MRNEARMLLMLAAFFVTLASAEAQATDLEQVRTTRAQCDELFKSRSFEALGKLLGAKISFTGPFIRKSGRQELIESLTKLATKRPDVVFEHDIEKIEPFEGHGIIGEKGVWRERWTEQDGPVTLEGIYQSLWMKQDGQWTLEAEQFVPLKCIGGKYCKPE